MQKQDLIALYRSAPPKWAHRRPASPPSSQGGVDSSVVVHLLTEAGYRPTLFYIQIGMEEKGLHGLLVGG